MEEPSLGGLVLIVALLPVCTIIAVIFVEIIRGEGYRWKTAFWVAVIVSVAFLFGGVLCLALSVMWGEYGWGALFWGVLFLSLAIIAFPFAIWFGIKVSRKPPVSKLQKQQEGKATDELSQVEKEEKLARIKEQLERDIEERNK